MAARKRFSSIKQKPGAFIPAAMVLMLLLMCAAPILSQRRTAETPSQDAGRWQIGEAVQVNFQRQGPLAYLSPLDQADLKSAMEGGRLRDTDDRAVVSKGTKQYLAFNLEFDSAKSRAGFTEAFKEKGVNVFNQFERFADIFVEVNRQTENVLQRIGSAAGLRRVELAGAAKVPPPQKGRPGLKSRERPDTIVRGGIAGLTGKGVIIAIVDSGIDFRNPDFITYDAAGKPTSRLLYLWDTTSNAYESQRLGGRAPIQYPNGASVGTMYTREQLTEELRSGRRRIPATDLNGHGTACAGIAAGNGNNGKGREEVIGVAPEADIIAVRIGGTSGIRLESAYLINAICGWLDKVAGERPLVVSCSFGSHRGGHDGQLVEERQLNARFSSEAKGRAIVVAAGNEGRTPLHSEVKVAGIQQARPIVFATGKEGGRLANYFDSANTEDIQIAPAKMGVAPNPRNPGEKTGVLTQMRIAGGEINPFTEQAVLYIDVAPGLGGVFLYNKSGVETKADIYISGGIFHSRNATYGELIGSPGAASNAITVGSYDWNDQFLEKSGMKTHLSPCQSERPEPLLIGGLSCYSSRGYNRNGVIKPDITGPGQYYHASYAKLPLSRPGRAGATGVRSGDPNLLVDASGNYMLFNGTSAATPYVAGVLALVMQKKPDISLGRIKELLKRHAARDQYTGEVPNTGWGHGKLNLGAVQKIIRELS